MADAGRAQERMSAVLWAIIITVLLSGTSILPLSAGGEPTRATPSKKDLSGVVPYHEAAAQELSGEAVLQMLFDLYGPSITQQDIRNVTKGRIDDGEVAIIPEMVRASHFSSESWMTVTQRGYRERALGYGAFTNDWTNDPRGPPSPDYASRFEDLKTALAEGYVVACYMYYDLPPEIKPPNLASIDPENPEPPPLPTIRPEDLAALDKVWRLVVGYDWNVPGGAFKVHDPLPAGSGALGGPAKLVYRDLFDALWNITIIDDDPLRTVRTHRYGLTANPWKINELKAPKDAEAGTVFEVSANITYASPSTLDGVSVQNPTVVLDLPAEFSVVDGTPDIPLEITAPRTYQVVTWSVQAPDLSYAGQDIQFYMNASGIATVSEEPEPHRDRIGATASFQVQAYGFLNHPPVVTEALVEPAVVPDDGSVQPLITARAQDQDGNLQAVQVDLTSVGGSSMQKMYDDGTNGDVVSGDGTYSYTITDDLPRGEHQLKVVAKDSKGGKGYYNLTLTVEDAATFTEPPDIEEKGATPSKVPNDGTTPAAIWAVVTDKEGDLRTVSADMGPLGGESDLRLYDDGTSGDLFASDGNFTATFTVGPEVALDIYQVQLTAEDEVGHRTSSGVWVEVILPPVGPVVIEVSVLPDEVINDGKEKVKLTAVVTDGNEDVDIVWVDLTPVKGSIKAQLSDDGKGADSRANDGTWSLEFTVPSSVTPGMKSRMVVTAEDSTGLTGTNTFSLNVLKANSAPVVEGHSLLGGDLAPRSEFMPGDTVVVTLNVSDIDNDLLIAEADLSELGLSMLELGDDGAEPDKEAEDLVFTGTFQIPADLPDGSYNITLRVEDPMGTSDEVRVRLNVKKGGEGERSRMNEALFIGLPVGLALVLIALMVVVVVRRTQPSVVKRPRAPTPGPMQQRPVYAQTLDASGLR